MARTGRPPSNNPKRHETRIRMTDEEVKKLEYAAEVLGLTKADVIRQGVERMYDEAKKKAPK